MTQVRKKILWIYYHLVENINSQPEIPVALKMTSLRKRHRLFVTLYDLYADFGPLFSTTDANEIKNKIAVIKPNGGGDTPELCLSGLQVPTANNNIFILD